MDWIQHYYNLTAFLDRGGVVLYILVCTGITLWFLAFERISYLHFQADSAGRALVKNWGQGQSDLRNYTHKAVQNIYLHQLQRRVPMIQTLIRVTPVLGLFGTVYGMIEIFDVIAQQGTGDARALANGISMATMPTMTGMAIAITGLFFMRHIEATTQRKIQRFNSRLHQS